MGISPFWPEIFFKLIFPILYLGGTSNNLQMLNTQNLPTLLYNVHKVRRQYNIAQYCRHTVLSFLKLFSYMALWAGSQWQLAEVFQFLFPAIFLSCNERFWFFMFFMWKWGLGGNRTYDLQLPAQPTALLLLMFYLIAKLYLWKNPVN